MRGVIINSSKLDFKVGDLVTVWTGGWEKRLEVLYEGRAGVITRIDDEYVTGYVLCRVDFGDGEVEVSHHRLRLLTLEN